jgi:hypothetical protein
LANHVSPLGTIVFGNIVDPRENPNSGRIEWNIGVVIPLSDAESLLKIIESALAEKRALDTRFPTSNDKLHMPYRMSQKKLEDGSKEDDPDNLLFTFKRNARYQTRGGETKTNPRPSLYDSLGRIVTETVHVVPGGTTGKVIFEPFVYDMPGSKGVQFQLRGFQIAEMKKQEFELQPIEGGWVSEEEDPIAAALAAG